MRETDKDIPVLFVPGAMSGAWIWEDNFAYYFREKGFPVSCLTFSGHGSSAKQRLKLRFEDYVQECVSAISSCSRAPIVIAHSLGGLVAMHAAARVPTHSMILLSPVPVSGVLGSMTSLAKRSPVSLAKFLTAACYAKVTAYGTPPIGIYSDTCDTDRADSVTKQLQSESLPVLLKLLSPPRLEPDAKYSGRTLFVAATGDHIIPPHEIRKSAETFGGEFKLYEGLSHTYQAEQTWSDIADDVLKWLELRAASNDKNLGFAA